MLAPEIASLLISYVLISISGLLYLPHTFFPPHYRVIQCLHVCIFSCQHFPGLSSSFPSLDHVGDHLSHSLPSLSVSLHMLTTTPALHGPAVEPPPPLSSWHQNTATTTVQPCRLLPRAGTSSSAVLSAVFPFSLLSFTPIPPQLLFCIIVKAPLTGT